MKRFIMILSMMLLLPVLVFSACMGGTDGGKDSPFRLYIDGYEWGAGVYKIVMDFGGEVGGNLQESLQLTTSSGSRRSEVETVSAYNCDEEGNRADTATRYAAFVIYPDSNDASPVLATLSRSVWSDDYTAELRVREGKTITVGGRTMDEGWTLRHVFTADERVITATEDFVKDSFTHDGITLTRALYTPYGAGYDDGPNPMIVWLHGGGEGGTDIEIALLGSKVTALTDENIQQNFEDESRDGAYVLAVQCPTMWMDGDGNGTMNNAVSQNLWKWLSTCR